METIYAISTNSGETLHTSPAYSTNGTKITLTTSSSNWIGATMEIFAIK